MAAAAATAMMQRRVAAGRLPAAAAPKLRLLPRDVRAFFRWGGRPQGPTLLQEDRARQKMLLERFEAADTNHDGRIDERELRRLLEAAWSLQPAAATATATTASWLTDAEVHRLMLQYDFDGSGDLDEQEFARLVDDGLLQLDGKLADLRAAFAAADADGSGDVSADELRAVLARCGRRASDEELRAAMLKAGVNERGHLPFASFVALLRDESLGLGDLNDALAFIGARPPPTASLSPSLSPSPSPYASLDSGSSSGGSSSAARAVIHALASPELQLVTTEQALESALANAGDEALVVLMAGVTWCPRTRALVPQLRELARGYGGAVKTLLLFGNFNDESKALFRDALLVRSTPAVFLYRRSELLCHFAGGDERVVERQVRRRLPASADKPALPLFYAVGEDSSSSSSGSDSDWE